MPVLTPQDALHAIIDAIPLLGDLLTTNSPQIGAQGVSTPASRPPLRLDIIDLIDTIHATLGTWVRDAHETGHVDDPDDWPADTPTAVALWLAHHDDDLRHHPARADYTAEVVHLWHRVRGALGEHPTRLRCVRAVPCETTGELRACDAVVDGIGEDGCQTEVVEHWRWCRCPDCGQTYTFDAALRRLGRLQVLTVPQFCAEPGVTVPERTMRRWVHDARVRAVGRWRGAPMYTRDDLERVAARDDAA